MGNYQTNPSENVRTYYCNFTSLQSGLDTIASNAGCIGGGQGLLGHWRDFKQYNPMGMHSFYDNKLHQIIVHALNYMKDKKDIQYVCGWYSELNRSGQEIFDELVEMATFFNVDMDFLIPRTLSHDNVLIDINVSGEGPDIKYGRFTKGTHLVMDEEKSTIIKITKENVKLINIDYLGTHKDNIIQLLETKSSDDSVYIIVAS